MGISSLGAGSSILTQDVLDQLREADEAQRIRPLTLNIANETDKKDSLKVIDASMTNLRDSINELKSTTLFDERSATISGTSVSMTAEEGSDIQEFTLDVTQLATKEINESGSYGAETNLIATDAGSMTIDVGDKSYTIDYTDEMTLKDLKKEINKVAGDDVKASIVQVSSGDFRLFFNAVNEGDNQNISITDNDGNLSDDNGETAGGTNLTDDMTTVQEGKNAKFTYNGENIERNSNNITDLISGYNITLNEVGSSTVNVEQNRETIESRVDSFVEKYNSTIKELSKQTVSSTDSSVRGIFSGDSMMKGMKPAIQNMIDSLSDAGGNMLDYGFSIDRDGIMSIDKKIFNEKIDDNPSNVEAFFTGGDFTKEDGSVEAIDGAFNSFYSVVNEFTKTNGDLDLVKTNIEERLSSYEDRKTSATERLDTKYAILKKQYAAYDSMISKFNSASSMFSQMITAENASR